MKNCSARMRWNAQPCLALERFVNGTQDCFSQKTNININNRFTVYNIKDLGAGMMNIGLQVCLDNIWNRMIENSVKVNVPGSLRTNSTSLCRRRHPPSIQGRSGNVPVSGMVSQPYDPAGRRRPEDPGRPCGNQQL